jgi:predicted permease
MMDSVRRALNRALAVFHGKRLDSDFGAEIATHLDAAIEDNLRQGMPPEEARRRALVRFGPVAGAMEEHREARGLPALETLLQDLRFALRTLRRDRAFACVVVLVLALGIGANVAVFSVVNTILLRPLPFRDPGRLVWFTANEGSGIGLSNQTYTVSGFEEIQRNSRSFQEMTSYQPFFNSIQYKLAGKGAPLPIVGVHVAGNFLPMLGIKPQLGRLFTAEECRRGGRAAALLSYAFWQRQYAGDPGIVGRTIPVISSARDIAGPVTVVGILPPSFDFGAVFSPGMQVDIFLPAHMDYWRTWGNTLAVIGRLKPGVSLTQAQAESDLLFPQLKAEHPYWYTDHKSALSMLQEHVSGKLQRSLCVLWCAVGLTLLIVCINLSNLMLARAMSRGKEFALRTALGAGRGRLVRQLLTESLMLCGAGAALGFALAWAITFFLTRQDQITLPMLSAVRLDGAALAWTALLAILVGALFGLAPAFKISAGNLHEALKDGGQGMSQGRRHERLRSALVVSEVALVCVLLVGAGLLSRSFLRVLDVDLGFQPGRVAAIKIEFNDGGSSSRRAPVLQEILARVRALPGIEAAGLTDMLPLDRNRSWSMTAPENANDRKSHSTFVYVVSPGYLETMGIRLLRGRDVPWREEPDTPPGILINEACARREWPGRDPLGRIARVGRNEVRIAGIVADVRESRLEEQASPQMFVPITLVDPEGTELVVRTRLPISTVQPAVFSTLRALNPAQPRTQLRALQTVVDHAVSPRRFLVLLVSAFAAFGLVLASLGIYGVISYSVTRQSQEIGIRMALGATAGRIQRGVVGQTLRLTLFGILLGSAASFALAKAIASLLFATDPNDPAIFAAMTALLGVIALLAGQIPARRAARIEPMSILRGV